MFEWFFGSKTEKYEVESDLFYPHDSRTIFFEGHHPSKILKKIGGIFKQTYRIKGADTYEDIFKWDIGNEKIIKFFVKWRARKEMDDRTMFFTNVGAQGVMDKKTSDGWVRVSYKGKLITTLPYTTAFDKALKHLYLRKFYIKQQRTYAKRMMMLLNDFDDNVRKLYGIETVTEKEEER